MIPENQDKYYTDLDRDLQRLATVDWAAFVKLIGEDAITAAKICLLKKRGKSLNQIAARLDVTREKARWNSQNCNC